MGITIIVRKAGTASCTFIHCWGQAALHVSGGAAAARAWRPPPPPSADQRRSKLTGILTMLIIWGGVGYAGGHSVCERCSEGLAVHGC